ncbi:MAG: multiheme c-type cytochrome [Anaerolineales bacterium]|nr:multiheme c-type cytochrome [Anaerolineales bacterium]
MKKRHNLSNYPLVPLLYGLMIGALSMGLTVGAAWAAPASQPVAQETPAAPDPVTTESAVPAKPCAECHPDVDSVWTESAHAHAFDNPEFHQRWKSLGEPGECLVCHTTGYQATTGNFVAEGVACESCHGAAVDGHPPAVVPVRADTDYCGQCHPITLGEWRLTGHASAEVGCVDCHNPHSQHALFESPDEMCINCHKDDIGEHQNDLHIQKGIGCVECHALTLPPETLPADGLAPTGHTFTITPATCVSCHTDTLRIGRPLPGYEDGAKAVSASLPVSPTLPTLTAQYVSAAPGDGNLSPEQQIQALEAALASTRLSTLFQGGIIGLTLGGATAYFVGRNQRRTEEEADGTADDAAGQGDEVAHE